MMNILITSAGKRVTLVQEFQTELKKTFVNSKVFTTDMNPDMAPACIVSDGSFVVPRVTDAGYIDLLFRLCVDNNVVLIVPTIDTELLLLASVKERFASIGVHIAVSATSFVGVCRDKRNTNAFFDSHRIRVPKAVDKLNPIFPMFAKPYDGSLSKDLYYIKSAEELTPEIMTHPKLIFMEYIDQSSYKEFTVDMYYGKDNCVKSIVPRERIEIRAGEINKGITRKNYLVDYLLERMGYIEGVEGCICIQLFYHEKTEDIVAIEINPRFGGGYPLSYHAGANYPQNLIREHFLKEQLTYDDSWKNNTLFLRYDSEVVVYEK